MSRCSFFLLRRARSGAVYVLADGRARMKEPPRRFTVGKRRPGGSLGPRGGVVGRVWGDFGAAMRLLSTAQPGCAVRQDIHRPTSRALPAEKVARGGVGEASRGECRGVCWGMPCVSVGGGLAYGAPREKPGILHTCGAAAFGAVRVSGGPAGTVSAGERRASGYRERRERKRRGRRTSPSLLKLARAPRESDASAIRLASLGQRAQP